MDGQRAKIFGKKHKICMKPTNSNTLCSFLIYQVTFL